MILETPSKTLADISIAIVDRVLKGEIVIVVDRTRGAVETESMEEALKSAMENMSVKDAATVVSEALGVPRRQVYQAALALGKTS